MKKSIILTILFSLISVINVFGQKSDNFFKVKEFTNVLDNTGDEKCLKSEIAYGNDITKELILTIVKISLDGTKKIEYSFGYKRNVTYGDGYVMTSYEDGGSAYCYSEKYGFKLTKQYSSENEITWVICDRDNNTITKASSIEELSNSLTLENVDEKRFIKTYHSKVNEFEQKMKNSYYNKYIVPLFNKAFDDYNTYLK